MTAQPTPPAGDDVRRACAQLYDRLPGAINRDSRLDAAVDLAVQLTEQRMAPLIDPEPILRRAEEATRRRDAEVEQRVREQLAGEYLASVNLLVAQQAARVAELEQADAERRAYIDRHRAAIGADADTRAPGEPPAHQLSQIAGLDRDDPAAVLRAVDELDRRLRWQYEHADNGATLGLMAAYTLADQRDAALTELAATTARAGKLSADVIAKNREINRLVGELNVLQGLHDARVFERDEARAELARARAEQAPGWESAAALQDAYTDVLRRWEQAEERVDGVHHWLVQQRDRHMVGSLEWGPLDGLVRAWQAAHPGDETGAETAAIRPRSDVQASVVGTEPDDAQGRTQTGNTNPNGADRDA